MGSRKVRDTFVAPRRNGEVVVGIHPPVRPNGHACKLPTFTRQLSSHGNAPPSSRPCGSLGQYKAPPKAAGGIGPSHRRFKRPADSPMRSGIIGMAQNGVNTEKFPAATASACSDIACSGRCPRHRGVQPPKNQAGYLPQHLAYHEAGQKERARSHAGAEGAPMRMPHPGAGPSEGAR